jgi:predicted DNA-binding ArsR family transcriptional regulator
MKAKEKAEQLVIQMYQPLPASKEAEKGKEHLYYNQFNAAKQCALIAVDEILKVAFYTNDEIYEHYIQVKQEIEKTRGDK